eukprot:4670275-Amphidinium_carterae.1
MRGVRALSWPKIEESSAINARSNTMTLWICTVREAVFESGMTNKTESDSPAMSSGRIKCDLSPLATSPGRSNASYANKRRHAVRRHSFTQAVVAIASNTLR